VQAFHKAGIPKGVINIVTGRGSEIGDYLTVRISCHQRSFAFQHVQTTPLPRSTVGIFWFVQCLMEPSLVCRHTRQ
jgi:Aldehyde dehydrogenase family